MSDQSHMNGAIDLAALQQQREAKAEFDRLVAESGLIGVHPMVISIQGAPGGGIMPLQTAVGMCPQCFSYVPLAFGPHHMAKHNGTEMPPMPEGVEAEIREAEGG